MDSIGGEPTTTTSNEDQTEPAVVPWIQALGILAFVLLGLVDLYVPEANIPNAIYWGIVTMVLTVKVDPKALFK